MALGEFDLIARYFRPLAGPEGLGLADDAALLRPPAGRDLVLSLDTMVGGVHFLPEDPPDTIARKLLRVNLSDLAAKGARPLGYLLALSLPRATEEGWIADFAAGLAADQARFEIALLGGDTTATPGPLTASITVLGHVAEGAMLRRAGAVAGDAIWVSGTLGDGALGLAVAQGQLRFTGPQAESHAAALHARYRLPQPRLALAAAAEAAGGLGAIAHAGMDVSDGLVQDLGHLCAASGGLGAELQAALLPLSPAAEAALAAEPGRLASVLAGGDDYELLLAAPDSAARVLARLAAESGIALRRIGQFTATGRVVVRDAAGRDITPPRGGYRHF